MKLGSLTKNVSVNLFAQLYTMLVGMFFFPVYLRYLGAESYGLIGFFSIMQSLCALMDIGFSQSASREAAKLGAHKLSLENFYSKYNQILKSVNSLAGIMFLCSIAWTFIFSSTWFNVEDITKENLTISLIMIFVTVITRWKSSVYRGVFLGLGEIYSYSFQLIIIATIRFVCVVPIMIMLGKNLIVFFSYQLLVSMFEVFFLKSELSKSLKSKDTNMGVVKDEITPNEPGMRGLWASSFLVLAFGQFDKLIFSGSMSLIEYGYFSLAVVLSSVVVVLSYPISTVTMYKMLSLFHLGMKNEYRDMYIKSTAMSMVILVPVTITLFYYADEVLLLWTRDPEAARHSSLYLKLYVIGNLFFVLSLIPYQLQFAEGRLKLHVLQFSILITIYMGIVYYYREIDTEMILYAWVILNFTSLVLGSYLIHRKFLPSFKMKWLLMIALPLIITVTMAEFWVVLFSSWDQSLLWRIIRIILTSFFTLVTIALAYYLLLSIGGYLKDRK